MIELIYEKTNAVSDSDCDSVYDYYSNKLNGQNYSLCAFNTNNTYNSLSNNLFTTLNDYMLSYLQNIGFNNKKICVNKFIFFKNYHNFKAFRSYFKMDKKFLFFYLFLNNSNGELLFFDNHKIKIEKGKLLLFPADIFYSFKPIGNLNNLTYICGVIYIDE